MDYFTAIKTALILFPLISFLFTTFFLLQQYHKYGAINPFRVLIIYSFILYLITIYFLVILPLPAKDATIKPIQEMVRLIPFSFILDIINETSFVLTDPSTYLKALTDPCIYTVLFNILMMIPLGMYLRYYFKCKLSKTIMIGFFISLFFEVTQLTGLYFIYPSPYRVFDVDDLILNTLGTVLGYFIIGFFTRFLPTREEIDQASIEAGTKVSGLRRITLFCLDLVIFSFITAICNLIISSYLFSFILFLLYYTVIPYFCHGKTIGSKFLNVRLEYQNSSLLNMFLRSLFLYFYYFGLPVCFLVVLLLFQQFFTLSFLETAALILGFSFIVIIFYLGNIIAILKNKTIFYDYLFKVTYKSTINERKKI